MHVFLTGGQGCGKSTVIDRFLALHPLRTGGFRTGYGPDRASPDRLLYLWPAGGPPIWAAERAVAEVRGGIPRAIPGRFDALGVPCLTGDAELVVMDECGRLERDARRFQAAVLAALDGAAPILGAVREGLPDWTAAIAAHPQVRLVTVTEKNRDALPGRLNRWLGGRHKTGKS